MVRENSNLFNTFTIMAEIYKNKNNFLVIKLNDKEAAELNFGIEVTALHNICLCGTCNNECSSEDIYYVACLNEVMCKDCINDFVNNSTHYDDVESLEYEVQHFNFIADKLKLNAHAIISSNAIMLYNKDKTKEHFKNYDK